MSIISYVVILTSFRLINERVDAVGEVFNPADSKCDKQKDVCCRLPEWKDVPLDEEIIVPPRPPAKCIQELLKSTVFTVSTTTVSTTKSTTTMSTTMSTTTVSTTMSTTTQTTKSTTTSVFPGTTATTTTSDLYAYEYEDPRCTDISGYK